MGISKREPQEYDRHMIGVFVSAELYCLRPATFDSPEEDGIC